MHMRAHHSTFHTRTNATMYVLHRKPGECFLFVRLCCFVFAPHLFSQRHSFLFHSERKRVYLSLAMRFVCTFARTSRMNEWVVCSEHARLFIQKRVCIETLYHKLLDYPGRAAFIPTRDATKSTEAGSRNAMLCARMT